MELTTENVNCRFFIPVSCLVIDELNFGLT